MPEKLNLWYGLMLLGIVLAAIAGFFYGGRFIQATYAARISVGLLVVFVIGLFGVIGWLRNRKGD